VCAVPVALGGVTRPVGGLQVVEVEGQVRVVADGEDVVDGEGHGVFGGEGLVDGAAT
jgi:hypothetical protein